MPQKMLENTSQRVSNFKIFRGSMPPDPPRYATRRACYASTVHYSRLLTSDQTSITFPNDKMLHFSILSQIVRK